MVAKSEKSVVAIKPLEYHPTDADEFELLNLSAALHFDTPVGRSTGDKLSGTLRASTSTDPSHPVIMIS